MASVWIDTRERKRKKGKSYHVYFRHPITRKPKHYKTFSKKRDADRAANDLRGILENGKPPEKKKRFHPMTFEEVGESLRKKWDKKVLKRELSKKTVEDYNIWLNVLNRTFRRNLLCEISAEEIDDYRMAVLEDTSLITSNRQLTVIKGIFKHGLEIGAILENLSETVKLLNEDEHERTRFIFPDEIVTLIEASKHTKAKFYLPPLIYLAVEHSTSRQEALWQERNKINFDHRGIGLIGIYRTKNKVLRTQYIMPRTRESLGEWLEHVDWMRHRKKIIPKNPNLVFSHLDGTPRKDFRRSWNRTCQIAGLEDLHYHDLRHTFGSNLLLSGANQKDAQNLMGHKHLSSTNRYLHLPDEHSLSKQRQLAAYYENFSREDWDLLENWDWESEE